jgi:hypothetical protein
MRGIATLLLLFYDRAQFPRSDQILVTTQRLLRLNQVLDRDDPAAVPKELDLDRCCAHSLELTDPENGAEEINRTQLGSISRSCTTEFPSDSLQLQRKVQRGLVLLGALVVGIAQTEFDETQVYSGACSFFCGGHD